MVAFPCTIKENLRPVRSGKGTMTRQAVRIVHDRGGQALKPTVYLPSRPILKN